MHPTLFGSVAAYSIFFLSAIVVGTAASLLSGYRAGISPGQLLWPLGILTSSALIGAKLYGLIERGGVVGPLSAEVLAQYRFPGGLIGVTAALLIVGGLGRVNFAKLSDVIAPSCAIAMAIIRIGCLLAGCCAGKPSSLPWAISFPTYSLVGAAQIGAGILEPTAFRTLSVHPLPIYFAGLSMSLAMFCIWLQPHKRFDGEVFLVYVTVYGLGQFLLEFLRFGALLHIQLMALAIGISFGAALLLGVRRSRVSQRFA